MVTLKDIAEQAGVSVMTVSRVVNGHQSKVSETTRNRILDIIKQSGYIPNYSARSLSTNTSHIIAIIIRGAGNRLTDVYNATMLGNIIERIQAKGYFAMTHFIQDYKEITQHLQTWRAEGAIFLGVFDENIQEIKEDNQIPIVFTDSYSSVRQITNIGLDDYKGGCLAAEYFIKNGHKEMAFFGTALDSSGVCQNRLKGFADTLKKHHLELKPEHIVNTYPGNSHIRSILSFHSPITAAFMTSDILAIELMEQLSSNGYRIPEDYSVIGFDNSPLCNYVTPKLTSISQDIEKKAYTATDILFSHIADASRPSENIILDVSLIERNSVRKLSTP